MSTESDARNGPATPGQRVERRRPARLGVLPHIGKEQGRGQKPLTASDTAETAKVARATDTKLLRPHSASPADPVEGVDRSPHPVGRTIEAATAETSQVSRAWPPPTATPPNTPKRTDGGRDHQDEPAHQPDRREEGNPSTARIPTAPPTRNP